jgi:hypothetical protein
MEHQAAPDERQTDIERDRFLLLASLVFGLGPLLLLVLVLSRSLLKIYLRYSVCAGITGALYRSLYTATKRCGSAF